MAPTLDAHLLQRDLATPHRDVGSVAHPSTGLALTSEMQRPCWPVPSQPGLTLSCWLSQNVAATM